MISLDLSDEDLKEIGMLKMAHRRQLHRLLGKVRGAAAVSSPSLPSSSPTTSSSPLSPAPALQRAPTCIAVACPGQPLHHPPPTTATAAHPRFGESLPLSPKDRPPLALSDGASRCLPASGSGGGGGGGGGPSAVATAPAAASSSTPAKRQRLCTEDTSARGISSAASSRAADAAVALGSSSPPPLGAAGPTAGGLAAIQAASLARQSLARQSPPAAATSLYTAPKHAPREPAGAAGAPRFDGGDHLAMSQGTLKAKTPERHEAHRDIVHEAHRGIVHEAHRGAGMPAVGTTRQEALHGPAGGALGHDHEEGSPSWEQLRPPRSYLAAPSPSLDKKRLRFAHHTRFGEAWFLRAAPHLS